MNKKDIIQRFIIENANVRGEIVNLTDCYQTIIGQHGYPNIIKKLLGETLVAACLMSAIIKFKGRLTVQFQGKDPLKLMLAQCTNDFGLRGLVQSQLDSSEEELMSALRQGILGIIISQDNSTARYQGIVSWQGDSLAKSLEGYFKDSEQLPTRLWIAVNETTAVGLLLQPMPTQSTLKSHPITPDQEWEHILHLSNTLTSEELLVLDHSTLLHRLFSQEQVRVFLPEPVHFICTCSLQRSEQAIFMLGEKEAEAELMDKQKIVVTCEFCAKEYVFDRVDVAEIFKKGEGSNPHIH